jgi:diaminopimelate decarboxylase
VTSEHQLRDNFRRLQTAFKAHYPKTKILYANKANANLAVRRILTDEGAGGDCFGVNELRMSLESGVPPSGLVLNGSNKQREELELAIRAGAAINVDHPTEFSLIATLARRLDTCARINLRVLPFSYAEPSLLEPRLARIATDKSHDKWGMDRATVLDLVPRVLAEPRVSFEGLHMHVSRLGPDTSHFRLATQLVLDCLVELKTRFGWLPSVLDMGGGFAHDRDPESGRPPGDHVVATPEDYADAVAGTLAAGLLKHGLSEPTLMVEPGRRLTANASVILTRVGIVKQLSENTETWVNVDASTNHCLRATSLASYHYQIVHATRGRDPIAIVANVTGPNCTPDVIGAGRPLPATEPGDLLSILDVGAYAETFANQFNLLPRPASVLVSGGLVDVIRRRETFDDLVALQQVPSRLQRAEAPATPS